MSETKLAEEFVAKGCGCTFLKGEQCCQQFSTEFITEVRSQCLSLSRDELEMAILGQIMANSNSCSSVVLEHGVSTRNYKGLTAWWPTDLSAECLPILPSISIVI